MEDPLTHSAKASARDDFDIMIDLIDMQGSNEVIQA